MVDFSIGAGVRKVVSMTNISDVREPIPVILAGLGQEAHGNVVENVSW